MDVGEIFVKVFNIGHSIYDAERARRRANQRSSELKELSEKIAPELGKTGNIPQQAEKTEPAASEGLVEAKDQGPPETTSELSHNIPQEKSEVATACVACAVGHFSTSSGELKEALRFKSEGMTSNEILDRIAGALEEQNALEREDLTPEKIQRLPEWEKEIAEEALTQSRQLRHRLESIQTIDELEQLAADTRSYYLKLSRQWYRGRFSKLGSAKAEVIAGKIGG